MRFLVISDIHGDSQAVRSILSEERDLDFILHGGDQDQYEDFGIPFYSLYGNHEDFKTLAKIASGQLKIPNWHYLQSGLITNITAGGESISVLGLGGTYSEKFSVRNRRRIPQGREKNMSCEDIDACLRAGHAEVFISHEASPKAHYLGREVVEQVIRAVRPTLAFSGHHHWYEEREQDGVRYITLPFPRDGYVIVEKKNGLITPHGKPKNFDIS